MVVPVKATSLNITRDTYGKKIRKFKARTPPPALTEEEARRSIRHLKKILPNAAICVGDDSDTDTASEEDVEPAFTSQPLTHNINKRKVQVKRSFIVSPRGLIEVSGNSEEEKPVKHQKKTVPNAAANKEVDRSTDTLSDHQESNYPPQPLQVAHKIQKPFQFPSCIEEVIERVTATEAQILKLSSATKGVRDSPLWRAHTVGRITAKNIHDIVNEEDPRVVLNSILHDSGINFSPSVKWGIDMEGDAKKMYCAHMRTVHREFIFEEVGLVLSKKFPFLAASPDGLSKCRCHGHALVKFECPFIYRHRKVRETLGDPNHYLDKQMCLKRRHKYYTQVQAQMLVCNVRQCDFVTWTAKDMVISQVLQNNDFCVKLEAKVTEFTQGSLIPEILKQDNTPK